MITPQMQAALESMKKLEQDIDHAQANIRFLQAMDHPTAIELQAKLRQGMSRLADMKKAIEAEGNIPPDSLK
jgi:hypothetical protein